MRDNKEYWRGLPVSAADLDLIASGVPYMHRMQPADRRYETIITVGLLVAAYPVYDALVQRCARDAICVQWIPGQDQPYIVTDTTDPDRDGLEAAIDSAFFALAAGNAPVYVPTFERTPDRRDRHDPPKLQPRMKETKETTMSPLETLIRSCSRDQLLALLADESVPIEALQDAACVLLGAEPAEPAPTKAKSPAAKADSGAAKVPKAAPKAKAAPKPAGDANAADEAVAALLASGAGFSRSDVVAVSEGAVTDAQATGAIKRAVASGAAKAFGEKRFARYGKTEAIAKKRSLADRKSAPAPGK